MNAQNKFIFLTFKWKLQTFSFWFHYRKMHHGKEKNLTWLAMDPQDPASQNLLCIFAVSLIFFSSSFFLGGRVNTICLFAKYTTFVKAEKNGRISMKRKNMIPDQTMMKSKASGKWKIVVSFYYNISKIYQTKIWWMLRIKWHVLICIRNIRCHSFCLNEFGEKDSPIMLDRVSMGWVSLLSFCYCDNWNRYELDILHQDIYIFHPWAITRQKQYCTTQVKEIHTNSFLLRIWAMNVIAITVSDFIIFYFLLEHWASNEHCFISAQPIKF